MREIIFDTETTGLKPEDGERIIEIGALEYINKFPTGNNFHTYINADGREVHPEAEKVHGITDAFLADKPKFSEIADDFLAFFKDAKLVAHNAKFDMGFVNAELKRLSISPFPWSDVIDTLQIARRKHPMGPNSLDALCKRYGIDNSHRTKHGALLDAELLADVYIEMLGGKQASLSLAKSANEGGEIGSDIKRRVTVAMKRPSKLPSRLSNEDIIRHDAFVETLGENSIWKKLSS